MLYYSCYFIFFILQHLQKTNFLIPSCEKNLSFWTIASPGSGASLSRVKSTPTRHWNQLIYKLPQHIVGAVSGNLQVNHDCVSGSPRQASWTSPQHHHRSTHVEFLPVYSLHTPSPCPCEHRPKDWGKWRKFRIFLITFAFRSQTCPSFRWGSLYVLWSRGINF